MRGKSPIPGRFGWFIQPADAPSLFAALVGLQAAVAQLQEDLENKRSGALLEQLAGDFQDSGGNHRNWARQTMTGLFLRHQHIRIYALNKRIWLAAAQPDLGFAEADVGMTGATGLLADDARLYQVRLEWRLQGGKWKASTACLVMASGVTKRRRWHTLDLYCHRRRGMYEAGHCHYQAVQTGCGARGAV